MSLQSAFDTPEGKRAHVRRLFATIADRYDLITAVLSYGQDARWKARLVSLTRVSPGERALDLACGTGDIAFGLSVRGARVVGMDLTPRMLEIANEKQAIPTGPSNFPVSRTHPDQPVPAPDSRLSAPDSRLPTPVRFLVGDMAALPFASSSFDVVTTGYGLRNVPDLGVAIDEIARVLRPGGRVLSLDFNRPGSAPVRAAYLAYLTIVGSTLGWILHRDPDTYRYIPESIRRYPGAKGVAALLAARGFTAIRIVPLLGGLMTLHLAHRAR